MTEAALTLDAVHLICQDMATMQDFYGQMLGLEQRRELIPFPDGPQDAWKEFKTGSASLVLKPRGQYDGEPRRVEMATIHIGLRAPTSMDVDERYQQLLMKGATTETPPIDWPWDERAFFMRDPEGNLVEIYYGETPPPVAQREEHRRGASLILDVIHITCNHLRATDDFYRNIVGLEWRRDMIPFPNGPQDPWPEFNTGGTSLVLKPIGPYDGTPRSATMAGTHLGFRVATADEVDSNYTRMAAHGTTFASPPRLWVWNERACFTHDREGNIVEIYHGATNPYDLDVAT